MLTPEANAELDRVAAAVNSTMPKSVAIAAGGTQPDSVQLAEPRYNAVAVALYQRGVSFGIIARAGLPATDINAAPTGYDRVEIILDFPK